MIEQPGELSVVARRRLNELLSEATPPDDPEACGPEKSCEPESTEWIRQLRAGGPGADGPKSDASGVPAASVLASAVLTATAAGPAPEQQASRSQWLQAALAFTRDHLVTVVVVLVVGIAWTGYSLFQTRTTPVADAAPHVEASGSASAGAAPSATASPAQLVIHVIGSVRRAGVYRLPEGARVADAIAAAGGLTRAAATGELNLAQVLSDGTQLKIGTRKHPGGWLRTGSDAGTGTGTGAGASANQDSNSATAKLSINSATEAQLDTLPGIGPVTAAKIVAWRKEHGKFTALTELQEVDGIGPKTYADLAERVRL